MACSVRLLEHPRCVEVTYRGIVTADDLAQGMRESEELAAQHALSLFLTDTSGITIDPSVFVLYDVANQLSLVEAPDLYREAVLADDDRVETARFYEDAMRNRGLSVRVFTVRADAEAWLVEQARMLGA